MVQQKNRGEAHANNYLLVSSFRETLVDVAFLSGIAGIGKSGNHADP
jgi:hypothetical protein